MVAVTTAAKWEAFVKGAGRVGVRPLAAGVAETVGLAEEAARCDLWRGSQVPSGVRTGEIDDGGARRAARPLLVDRLERS